MFEQEEWDNPFDETKALTTNRLFKSTNYVTNKIKLSSGLDFYIINYYQVGYDEDAKLFRQRISTELNLTTKIYAKLFFNMTFTGTYENHPVIPIKKFIYTLNNGFSINL